MQRIIGSDRHFNGIRQNVTFSSHTWLFDANHRVSLHARVVFAQNFSLSLSISFTLYLSLSLGKFNGVVEVHWANKIQCPMAHRHHCLININVRQEESIFIQQRPTHQIQIHCCETGDSSTAITLYQMKITTNNCHPCGGTYDDSRCGMRRSDIFANWNDKYSLWEASELDNWKICDEFVSIKTRAWLLYMKYCLQNNSEISRYLCVR